MSLSVELKPKRRLKDIDVFEVSFVDKAANGRKFLVFKRSEGGGDIMENVEIGINKTNDEKRQKLEELSTMLNHAKKAKRIVYKESEEIPAEELDQTQYDELKQEIEDLKLIVEELGGRLGSKDKLISLLKSREERSKITHAHAPSPTLWAKDVLKG